MVLSFDLVTVRFGLVVVVVVVVGLLDDILFCVPPSRVVSIGLDQAAGKEIC